MLKGAQLSWKLCSLCGDTSEGHEIAVARKVWTMSLMPQPFSISAFTVLSLGYGKILFQIETWKCIQGLHGLRRRDILMASQAMMTEGIYLGQRLGICISSEFPDTVDALCC